MSSWRDAILNDFVPNVSKLTLVADPDCLLTEEKLAVELHQRGFEILEFNDPVAFRYAYESKYRSIWDRCEHTDLVVVLRLQNAELEALPYDLLQAGRKLSFNLGDLFPKLSYPVIEKLERSLLDPLFEAQSRISPERLGDNATKDFVLQQVFGINAEIIRTEVDLLRSLLRIHYGKLQIPHELLARVTETLAQNECFANWPLERLLFRAFDFYEFLQERWQKFLESYQGPVEGYSLSSGHETVEENTLDVSLKIPGPVKLPLDHEDVRIYIDNLFLEGKLKPVEMLEPGFPSSSWVHAGIQSRNADRARAERLFDSVVKNLPNLESRYSEWLQFAQLWAELSAVVYATSSIDRSQYLQFGEELNQMFAQWLASHFSSLMNLPPTQPAMLHHVPRRLARDLEDKVSSRVALMIMDGLSLDQWVSIRELLIRQDPGLAIHESATFAWIPTLTSVSRQTIFAGKPPFYFPSSIKRTDSESRLWQQFWEDQGVARMDVVYQLSLGTGDPLSLFKNVIHPSKTKVLGLVIDTVDKIMHGMQLGSAGMHNQIKQWCEGRYLVEMVDKLLQLEFDVWLTADHGNIECLGRGMPSEGVLAETRGERVRVYPTEELRSQVADRFEFSRLWEPIGLPPNYFPLVTRGREAFAREGDLLVGHGGISIEEVIVPLVRFSRKSLE